MIQTINETPCIRLIKTDKVWTEGDALLQLGKTARMEGMVDAARENLKASAP